MPVYKIKVAIRDISPMVWRRFRLHSNMSLGAFHFLLQFAFGWDNDHLHTFHIHGKDYGIRYEGGLGFYDNPWSISLASFQFENRDKFTYEYNFFRHWLLDIRIEAVESDLNKNTPFCLSGQGMPDATEYDETEATIKLLEAIAESDDKTTWGDIQEFIDEYNRVKFNRRRLNQLLKRYDFDTPNYSQGLDWYP
ncbi:plasmid pRiA4b ORF-3 family protein [Xenorhabdus szentirmaii]|nr:plasmid pRiA4b ORF-3 family protein [Xenorhabdus sp. 38]MBD2782845.1 plasmid pRiA4b ORF-3 family protein [Xenorhabdus sp. 38]